MPRASAVVSPMEACQFTSEVLVEEDWLLLCVARSCDASGKQHARAKARGHPNGVHASCAVAGRKPCVVPQVFSMSPMASPRHVADFMVDTESTPTVSPTTSQPVTPESVERPEASATSFFRASFQFEEDYFGEEPRATPNTTQSRDLLAERGDLSFGPSRQRTTTNALALQHSDDDFVLIQETSSTWMRRWSRSYAAFAWHWACRHPRLARCLIWTGLSLLMLGELATTIWWLVSIGFRGLLLLSAPAGLSFSIGVACLGGQQATLTVGAMILAALPALPLYTAVLLILPVGQMNEQDSCWEVLDWLAMVGFGVMYLATALVQVLRAEHPSPGFASAIVKVIDAAAPAARGACVLAAWLYVAVLLNVAATSLLRWGQKPEQATTLAAIAWSFWGAAMPRPWLRGRGLIVSLHALGMLCAKVRRCTTSALGEELLPLLLGRDFSQTLSPRAFLMHHGRRLLKRVPALRDFTPPATVVAFVIAVRRTAPIVFPVLALLPHFAGPDKWEWLCFSSLCLGLLVLIVVATLREGGSLPKSQLRRLPLLLPSGVAPCTRKFIGFALVAAERVEQARGGVVRFRAHLKKARTES